MEITKLFNVQSLHKSPWSTALGVGVILLSLYQQYETPDWLQNGIGLAIGLGLCFLPDNKKKYNQVCDKSKPKE
jgi:hypothetical protein